MTKFWALVQILKALIDIYSYLTGRITKEQLHARMDEMEASIKKATEGPLAGRLEGGRQVEDQLNQHVGGGK